LYIRQQRQLGGCARVARAALQPQAGRKAQREGKPDFEPTLAAEYLGDSHGIHAGRETVRGWMIESKLWRQRRSRVGELVASRLLLAQRIALRHKALLRLTDQF
jgi:hypothetical protein